MGSASGVLKKRTRPTYGEIQVLELLGAGFIVREISAKLDISYHTAHDRVRRLKFLARKRSLSGLMYWGLRERYVEYGYRTLSMESVTPIQIQIVERLAQDEPESKICRAIPMTEHQVQGQLRIARRHTGARNRAHLVAIFWTEGWIV